MTCESCKQKATLFLCGHKYCPKCYSVWVLQYRWTEPRKASELQIPLDLVSQPAYTIK